MSDSIADIDAKHVARSLLRIVYSAQYTRS